MKDECIRCVTTFSENVMTLALGPWDQDRKPERLRKIKLPTSRSQYPEDGAYNLDS